MVQYMGLHDENRLLEPLMGYCQDDDRALYMGSSALEQGCMNSDVCTIPCGA